MSQQIVSLVFGVEARTLHTESLVSALNAALGTDLRLRESRPTLWTPPGFWEGLRWSRLDGRSISAPVSSGLFNTFGGETGLAARPGAPGDPVVDVTFTDALAFCAWASRRTDRRIELPTAAECERARGAGTTPILEWSADRAPGRPDYRRMVPRNEHGEYPAYLEGYHDVRFGFRCVDRDASAHG